MNKLFKLFYGFVAMMVTALAVSCSSDDLESVGSYDGSTVTVSLNVTAPDALETTRALSGSNSAYGGLSNVDLSSDYVLRYQLKIYEVTTSDDETTLSLIDEQPDAKGVTSADESATFTATLTTGSTYKFVVWADFVEATSSSDDDTTDDTRTDESDEETESTSTTTYDDLHYDTSGATDAGWTITCKDEITAQLNDESRDAYYACLEQTISSGATINIECSRPFAKIRLVTTDWDEGKADAVSIQYTGGTRFTDIDLLTGYSTSSGSEDLSSSSDTYTASIPDDAYADGVDAESGKKTLVVDYLMTDYVSEQTTINFIYTATLSSETVKTLDITTPIQRNYLTTVTGNLLTTASSETTEDTEATTTEVTITCSALDDFEEDEITEYSLVYTQVASLSFEDSETYTEGVKVTGGVYTAQCERSSSSTASAPATRADGSYYLWVGNDLTGSYLAGTATLTLSNEEFLSAEEWKLEVELAFSASYLGGASTYYFYDGSDNVIAYATTDNTAEEATIYAADDTELGTIGTDAPKTNTPETFYTFTFIGSTVSDNVTLSVADEDGTEVIETQEVSDFANLDHFYFDLAKYLNSVGVDNVKMYTVGGTPMVTETEEETTDDDDTEYYIARLYYNTDSITLTAQDGATADNLIKWNINEEANEYGFSLAITGNTSKALSYGSPIYVDGTKYTTIKLSNGAQNTVYLPDGVIAKSVTIHSIVNYSVSSKGEARDCYWAEVNGVTYTYEDTPLYVMTDDYTDATAETDIDEYTFDISGVTESFTFKNSGEQPIIVLDVKYYYADSDDEEE